ncbi:MAG: MFS transporter [Erysipelotrichaceae bacterium]|jgi:MFS family permease|nr:MFS transporter [Erysipelotrichaceae bacterium]
MKLTKDELLVLSIVGIYTLASTMVSTFANVYMLKYTSSLTIMSTYSLIRYLVIGFFAWASAKLSTKIRMSYTLMIGLFLIICAVLFLLFVKDWISTRQWLVYIVGFVWGAGEGFFWITINTLYQLISHIETRGFFLGVSGMLQYLASILAPFLSALILSFAKVEDDGYLFLFEAAIVIFVIICIASLKIRSTASGKPFHIKESFTHLDKDPRWRYLVVCQFLWGMREAATVSLTGLLIYQALGSGSSYGNWLAFFALVATFANFIIGRKVNKQNRLRYLFRGCILLFLSGLALVSGTRTGAIVHGLLHYGFLSMASMPFSLMYMNVISEYGNPEQLIGRTVAREVIVAIARAVGLLIVILTTTLAPGSLGMNAGMLILYSFCLWFLFYCIRGYKRFQFN